MIVNHRYQCIDCTYFIELSDNLVPKINTFNHTLHSFATSMVVDEILDGVSQHARITGHLLGTHFIDGERTFSLDLQKKKVIWHK